MSGRSDLFRCDGASAGPLLKRAKWDRHREIKHSGASANLTLRVENLSHALVSRIDDRAGDLVRIAAYVYAADQMVSRSGEGDVHADRWRRRIGLAIPVAEPDFWNAQTVQDALLDALGFASEDDWEFHFERGAKGVDQLPLNTDKEELHANPDSVIMFSGGADSLCATIEAVAQGGHRPLLVSHRPMALMNMRQEDLVKQLRKRLTHWIFPHISYWVHRVKTEASDTNQRVRPLLFASLGASVAHTMGLTDVVVADNGVVSLNVPVNRAVIGSLATKSTHPRFLWLMNRLLGLVFEGRPPVLRNTLADRTRPEVLDVLRKHRLEELLPLTVSCVHTRGKAKGKTHCGVCSQCVDRRFAMLASGLAEQDPIEKYEIDLFRDGIPDGPSRVYAVSYVRFAARVKQLTGEEIFVEYPQLTESILPDDPSPSDAARRHTGLLHRHGQTIMEVMEEQIRRLSPEISQGALDPHSLIALNLAAGEKDGAAAENEGVRSKDGLLCSPDFRSLVWRGKTYSLTEGEASAFRVLHQSSSKAWRSAALRFSSRAASMPETFARSSGDPPSGRR